MTRSRIDAAQDALKEVSDSCGAAEAALLNYWHAIGERSDEKAAFVILHARLFELSEAIGAVSSNVTRLAPEVPWCELRRLPALLTRADIRHDAGIFRLTLGDTLPRVRNQSALLIFHLASHRDVL